MVVDQLLNDRRTICQIRDVLRFLLLFHFIPQFQEFRRVEVTGRQRLKNGLLGKISNDECHTFLYPFGILYERIRYFTFTAEVFTAPIAMLSGEPVSTVRSAAEQFFTTNPVFVEILLGILFLSATIGIIENISNPTSTSSFGNYLYGMVTDLLEFFKNPNDILSVFKTRRSRLLLVLRRFSFLIIKIRLGASVNAELAISKTNLIDDYRDLLDRPNLQPLIFKNSLYHAYFSKVENVEEKALWRQVQRTKGLFESDKLKDYRRDISSGKSVLIADPVSFGDVLPESRRDTEPQPRLRVSRRPSTWFSNAILVSRSFPEQLLENTNVFIRRYVEFSHIDHVMGAGFSEYSFCLWKPSESKTFRRNKNVNFLSYLWSSATWISSLTFVIELIVFYTKGKRRIVSISMLAIFSIFGVFFWSQIAPA